MKVLVIDNGTNLLEKLQNLIPGSEITRKFEDVDLKDINALDLIVLSGSSKYSPILNQDDFKNEISLIISDKKPLIGICFGCELVAEAFGGKLRELSEKEHGIKEIEILDRELIDLPSIKVYEGHKCAISEVPASFEVLAKSSTGPEIIKHKNFPIYGFQFHPENLVDKTQGDELFLSLLSKFQKEGLQSS